VRGPAAAASPSPFSREVRPDSRGEERRSHFLREGSGNQSPSFSPFLVWREPRLLLDNLEGISGNWHTIFRATWLLDSGTRLMVRLGCSFPILGLIGAGSRPMG
jgi:hypothetical protein